MSTRDSGRRRAVAVLAAVAAAATGAALPAQAVAPRPAHDGARDVEQAPSEGLDRVATVQRVETGEGTVGAAAVTPAACPVGTVRSRTLLTEGFEDGLPDGGLYTEGWGRSTGAPVGSYYAASAVPSEPDGFHYMFLEDSYASPGTRTVLSFLVRGTNGGATPPESNTGFYVNDEGWSLFDLEADEWFRVTADVTAGADLYDDGYLEILFAHAYDETVPDTGLAVDDVQVLACAPPPASGVRGDWTGEGLVDLLGVTGDGALYLYPGRGNGTVASGTQVGAGWGAMTWMGSPGDITGDRRTDLLARRSDGVLFRYDGRGAGAFGSATQVGTGWNGMTAIATGGDLNGDGVKDVLGRHADGRLFQYGITSTGRLTSAKQVGTGWNGMRELVALGDVDGDRRADLLGVHSNGDLYLYYGAPTGLRNGGKVGTGWGAMELISSPGDLNRDGRGDVVARSVTGDLWFYAGTASGLRGGVKIGTGWGAMARVL